MSQLWDECKELHVWVFVSGIRLVAESVSGPVYALRCFSFQIDCKVVENLPPEHMTVGVLVWPGSRGWDQADLLALSAEDHVAMVTSLASVVLFVFYCVPVTPRFWNAPTRWYWRLSAWVNTWDREMVQQEYFFSDLSSLYVQPSWL